MCVAYISQDLIRRSAVLKADCTHPSEPKHPRSVPLLGRYMSHVLWNVAVLVFFIRTDCCLFLYVTFWTGKKRFTFRVFLFPPSSGSALNFHFSSWRYLIWVDSIPTTLVQPRCRHGRRSECRQLYNLSRAPGCLLCASCKILGDLRLPQLLNWILPSYGY